MFMKIGLIVLAVFAAFFLYGVFEGIREAKAETQELTKEQTRKQEALGKVDQAITDILNYKRSLAQPGAPVTITDDISTELLESRIGGRPAWPRGKEHPRAKGKFPFVFLAQINLADMPALADFPQSGLLQFFFAADDLYGLAFPEVQDGQINFNNDIHVILHEDIEDMEEWVMFTGEDETYDLSVPFDYPQWWEHGYRLSFAPAQPVVPTFDDYRLYDSYWDLQKLFADDKTFFELSDKWRSDQVQGMVIGGHPFFSQMDPRYYNEELRDYSHTLLSIDSVSGKFMWGDVGTGSFLIRPEDLKARRFDTVLSNYDCL